MRLSRTMQIAVTGSALSLAMAANPAHAHEGPAGGPPMPAPGYASAPYEEMAPEVRDSWLADCHARMDRRRGGYAADFCETYLDNYYAQYRGHQPYGYQGSSYGYPGYSGGCCQPMMMVPVMRMQRAEPDCKETVEYEYVDAPVRASRPPRPAPDKRVKIIPDKRIPMK